MLFPFRLSLSSVRSFHDDADHTYPHSDNNGPIIRLPIEPSIGEKWMEAGPKKEEMGSIANHVEAWPSGDR